MKVSTPHEGEEKLRDEFLDPVQPDNDTPVRIPALGLDGSSRPKGDRFDGCIRREESHVLPHLGDMGNKDVDHCLERRSNSVSLVFGSHEPIPSVCCTITGTGPDPGHFTWSYPSECPISWLTMYCR